MRLLVPLLWLSTGAVCSAQDILTDPGVSGPPLEVIHLYYDEWPTGVAVSSTGRIFSNYPGGLDANNTNNGTNNRYTVAELTTNTTETPYPSLDFNNPPGGAINYSTTPPSGANYPNHLIGVQSVVIDPLDRLWILDTGRVLDASGTLVPSVYGGPKLIGINLTTNAPFQTILFPETVAYLDSYLNDVRFDLRANLTGTSGQGVAYITDSSTVGRNGLVVVDLGSGVSWRHLTNTQPVHPEAQFVAYVQGTPLYSLPAPGQPYAYTSFGSDGIALSADGETLFWGSVASRYLYSIPTARVRDNSTWSEVLAQAAVQNRGQKGVSDGFETDSNDNLYFGNMEQNGVTVWWPENNTQALYVRDPRVNWVDTLSTGADGWLYFTVNQLYLSSSYYPGTDRRTRPFVLFRVPLPDGGRKVQLV